MFFSCFVTLDFFFIKLELSDIIGYKWRILWKLINKYHLPS